MNARPLRLTLPPSYLPPVIAARERFIAVEGVSGAGKSTVVKLLADKLAARTVHVMPGPYAFTEQVNLDLAALPQLAYYLSGLTHAGDLVRQTLATAPMVTDRYAVSVIANHAAIHSLPLAAIQEMSRPLMSYLPAPDVTVYLRTSEATIRRRMQGKPDINRSDRQLLNAPGLLDRVLAHYDALIAEEPSGLWVETDRMSPEEIAAYVLRHIEDDGHER